MINIPSRFIWPGLILLFLSFNITMSMIMLTAARSDGGAQIVPDYYQKSVDFDQEIAARRQARARGWELDASLHSDHGLLRLRNSADQAVVGVEGVVAFSRPFLTEPIATVALNADPDLPGAYRFDNLANQAGLWDLEFFLKQDDTPTLHPLRLNLTQ